MSKIVIKAHTPNGYYAELAGPVERTYRSDIHDSRQNARQQAKRWLEWSSKIASGGVSTIYHILEIPATWPGPPVGGHPYTGLRFKIGRTNDLMRRYANLRTGTSSQLIIHAIEPGFSKRERELHSEFLSERRQGEWFTASQNLAQHVMKTWEQNIMLPPEHQQLVLQLHDRIGILRGVRGVMGGAPDMINPSLNDPWHGNVFIDLVYAASTWTKRDE